ncbi:MAG: alpha/beta hydrolase family protein [Thermodesulforhabdaceae bacterium]|jgi:alpha-beta hydrolase superfamily lysophospholipase
MNSSEDRSHRFFIHDGEIPVVINEPEGASVGTVVLLHGLLGHKDSEKFVTIARSLASRGWRAVRFDQAGSGESKSPLRVSLIYSRLRDLVRVVSWLKKAILHDREDVYLWGSSLGGYISYLYGFFYQFEEPANLLVTEGISVEDVLPVKAVISWATPFDISLLHDFLKRTPPFCNCLDPTDPVGSPRTLEKIKASEDKSCLIVHGMKDEIVSWYDALKIRNVTQGDLFIFDHADHRFSDPDDRKLAIKASITWLERKSLTRVC